MSEKEKSEVNALVDKLEKMTPEEKAKAEGILIGMQVQKESQKTART